MVGSESSPERELLAVLSTFPTYIVRKESVWYLQKGQENILNQGLIRNYKLVALVNGRRIYEYSGEIPVGRVPKPANLRH